MKLFNFSTSILFQWVRYLSIYKIVNLIKLRISYLFSRLGFQPIWNIYPHFISIETTNFCNLHCPECPVGSRNESKTTKSSFDFALYKRLITELKPSLQHVMLYFQGEPFLNTHLMEFIRHAHDANIYTSVSTNGQFLNEKTAKEIVMSGLDKLIVSMDGTTQEVY
jgi:MoaA/NifB/PqqE/SkfB family radical SAM enzyme